jgi:hypothetical protein
LGGILIEVRTYIIGAVYIITTRIWHITAQVTCRVISTTLEVKVNIMVIIKVNIRVITNPLINKYRMRGKKLFKKLDVKHLPQPQITQTCKELARRKSRAPSKIYTSQ